MKNNPEELDQEFVPYEESLALKELGFDELCFGDYYNADDQEEFEDEYIWTKVGFDLDKKPRNNSYWNKRADEAIAAPLYQQVFKWFRKKHGVTSWVYEDKHGFSFMLWNINYTTSVQDTYEEAELACLQKLIEIAKEKKKKKKK